MRGCMRGLRTRSIAAGALVCAVAGAGAAAAQDPPAPAPEGNFGGGALHVPVSEKTVARDMLIAIRVRSGGRVAVEGHMFAACGLGRMTGETTTAPDGSFTLRGRATKRPAAGVAQTYRFVVRGVLTAAGAGGTAKLTVRARTSRTKLRVCNSRTVSWTARRPSPAVASAAAPARATTLYGLTAQRASRARRSIVLHVADGGRSMHRLAFGYRTRCERGRITVFSNVEVTPQFDIAADGSFRTVDRFEQTHSDVVQKTTVVVRGRFDAAGAVAGKLAVTERFYSRRSGRRVDLCRTGTTSWAARS